MPGEEKDVEKIIENGYISAYHMVVNITIPTLRLHVHKCLKNTEDTQSLTITWHLTRKCADAMTLIKGHISGEH